MDEKNVEHIQKFLIAQLSLTPRRKLFEDYLLEMETGKFKKSEYFQETEDGQCENENNGKNQWKLIKHLREFRETHASECMNQIKHRKFSRAMERDEDILNRSNYFKGPPSTEELIMLIDHDKKKESIRSRFNALNFQFSS